MYKEPFEVLARCKSIHRHFIERRNAHCRWVRLSRVDRWAGRHVLEARVVDGLAEDRVGELVRAGKRDAGRSGAAATSDLDLEARDVRLRVAGTRVEGNRFGADEVVS